MINAVWNELQKENKEFFEAYTQSESKTTTSEEEIDQIFQKMTISKSPKGSNE